jgi:hypothetical protein
MVALSFPIRFATWIFSHFNPIDPNFLPSENYKRPLDKSAPIWFKWGGMGYTRPLKSKFCGKYIFSISKYDLATLNLRLKSHLNEC